MRKLLLTMGVRGAGAFGSALFLMLYASYSSPELVGAFQYAVVVALGLAILSRRGLDRSIVSCLPRYPEQCHGGVLRSALLSVIISSFLIMLAMLAVLYFFHGNINLPFSVYPVIFSFPLISISLLFSGFYKSKYKPNVSFAYEIGVVSLLASMVFLIGVSVDLPKDLVAPWSFFTAFLVLSLVGLALNGKTFIRAENSTGGDAFKEMKSKSSSFFLMTFSVYVQQFAVAVMLSQYLGNHDLGLFKVSEKIVLVIGFFQVVVNSIYSPHFSREHSSRERLAYYARKSCMLSVALSVPVFIIVVFSVEHILSFIGDEYIGAKNLVLVMAIGQLVNVITGPAGMILNMTNHEKINRNILLLCSLLSVPCVIFLSQIWGAIGAAVALMGTVVLQNSLCYLFVFLKLNFFIVPTYEAKT